MRLITAILSALFSSLVLADCQDNADGFASLNGGTTGGNGGTVVTVTTFSDLVKYAAASGPYVIKVSGRITVTPFGYEIPVSDDKTIIGVGTTGEIYQGGFGLKPANNVIIRNLKIGTYAVANRFEYRHRMWTNRVQGIPMMARRMKMTEMVSKSILHLTSGLTIVRIPKFI
jgi:pectate lyase